MEHGRGRQPGGRIPRISPSTVRPGGAAARRIAWAGLPLLALGVGCGIAPRSFRALTHPAPVVRARSVGYGDGLPDGQVVPALINRLDDADPVVRLTAHEELRRRTGQDFGYVPWAPAPDRAGAIKSWRAWWQGRLAQQPAPANPNR